MAKAAAGRRNRARRTATYTIKPRNRYWEVRDALGQLVCLTVYKRGAVEVVRRLAA